MCARYSRGPGPRSSNGNARGHSLESITTYPLFWAVKVRLAGVAWSRARTRRCSWITELPKKKTQIYYLDYPKIKIQKKAEAWFFHPPVYSHVCVCVCVCVCVFGIRRRSHGVACVMHPDDRKINDRYALHPEVNNRKIHTYLGVRLARKQQAYKQAYEGMARVPKERGHGGRCGICKKPTQYNEMKMHKLTDTYQHTDTSSSQDHTNEAHLCAREHQFGSCGNPAGEKPGLRSWLFTRLKPLLSL
jgi:hypothetical protein